jgi:hypothetical protein
MSEIKPKNGNLAQVEGQDDLVFWGSDLALIGLFVSIIRKRFSDQNVGQLPWYWKEDPRPEDPETNEATQVEIGLSGTSAMSRTLMIESELQDDPEARNFSPAIYVGVESTQYAKVVVGDRYGIDRSSRFEAYYAQAIHNIKVSVTSRSKGECNVLANIVHYHLIATKNIVRDQFSILALEGFTKTKPEPFRRSSDEPDGWIVPILFNATIEERWFTRPNAPLLAEIRADLELLGNSNARNGALKLALYGNKKS